MSPALFWDSQPAQLPLLLGGNLNSRENPKNIKIVVTRRVPIPIPWTDKPQQSHRAELE
jgi:hypothetical protein